MVAPPIPREMPIDYPAMVPPGFEAMPESPQEFKRIRPKDAKKLLDWYVGESEARLDLLLSAVEATDGPLDQLDFTYDSLDVLWDWAAQFFSYILLPEEEYEQEVSQYPWHVADELTEVDMALPSHWNKVLAPDIGFYVFKLFQRYSEAPYWGLSKFRVPSILGWANNYHCISPITNYSSLATGHMKDGGRRPPGTRSKFRSVTQRNGLDLPLQREQK